MLMSSNLRKRGPEGYSSRLQKLKPRLRMVSAGSSSFFGLGSQDGHVPTFWLLLCLTCCWGPGTINSKDGTAIILDGHMVPSRLTLLPPMSFGRHFRRGDTW